MYDQYKYLQQWKKKCNAKVKVKENEWFFNTRTRGNLLKNGKLFTNSSTEKKDEKKQRSDELNS